MTFNQFRYINFRKILDKIIKMPIINSVASTKCPVRRFGISIYRPKTDHGALLFGGKQK